MTKNNKKGFTIIEVVLVLAIAGLIFLMVFIALPALQRSQRNTRRRQDMARILTAFNDYQANNNGKMPTVAVIQDPNKFIEKYIKAGSEDAFKDPDGADYKFVPAAIGSETNGGQGAVVPGNDNEYGDVKFDHNIYYNRGAKCGSEEGDIVPVEGDRQITLVYVLEGGAIYCGDNQ